MTRAGRRGRGGIDQLPSGIYRVRVYAGQDPLTGRRHYLTETAATEKEAERARTRLLSEVDEKRNPRSKATVNQLIDRYLDVVELERTTRQSYIGKIEKHIRPELGRLPVARVDAELLETFYALLRRCRDHCHGRKYVQHRTEKAHACDARCKPHVCEPLSAGSILVVHAILSGALERAVRWRWLGVNPAPMANKPAVPTPNPTPPTASQAAEILRAAWADDLDWGTLIWLAMVTGARRGEICGIRLSRLDLDGCVLTIEKSQGQIGGQGWEKDTKTHQSRRIALDEETVRLLKEHVERIHSRAAALGLTVSRDAFLFSLEPNHSRPMRPDTVTQRYLRQSNRLGIATNLKALRHYSATELIAAGVDPRTVAGRLGHGGGGSTTLRVYSAWVSEADQRAATGLGAGMPSRPTEADETNRQQTTPNTPYECVAAAVRARIISGEIPHGNLLPSEGDVCAEHGVGVSTARRATALLRAWGCLGPTGRRVIAPLVLPPPDGEVGAEVPEEEVESAIPTPDVPTADSEYWSVTLRKPDGHRCPPRLVRASMTDPDSFRPHLVGIVRMEEPERGGPPDHWIGLFELEVRRPAVPAADTTFATLRWDR